MNKAIGEKVKQLRMEQEMTLKDLSEATGFSTGFLSQLERGLTSIAVDVLAKIGEVLGVQVNTFFPPVRHEDEDVLRYHERRIFQVENINYMHYHLTNEPSDKVLLPRLIEILPGESQEHVELYGHQGEEFIYVLEGRLTLLLEDKKYILYPRDTAHYHSSRMHNWANTTNNVVKILVVSTPNPYVEAEQE